MHASIGYIGDGTFFNYVIDKNWEHVKIKAHPKLNPNLNHE